MNKEKDYNEISLLEMSVILGEGVKIEKINFSFFFSPKIDQQTIWVRIVWNKEKTIKQHFGFMELSGNYEYIRAKDSNKHIAESDITAARNFFKKYKVIFAAVWEYQLEQTTAEDFFKGKITLKDLIRKLEIKIEKEDIEKISNLADFEKYVRDKNLFNMCD